ncbi:serine/threonine-protein kinase Nek10-like isoform X3 [Chiloscyllium plagiosum]|uniref:serine/threonine-protein kinase Nek10-like isoform X3 n=1 Tax=Chiloscyllium plagiosum TaxID=36176 RepID=UPI001CB7D155|nr:serine/threonine-protein kinase Nek10-like isoform X3 [Chiloscyllium plagiosum]
MPNSKEVQTNFFCFREYSDLKRLLNLLNVPASKQQLPALNVDKGHGIVTKSQQQRFVQGKQNDGIRYGEQQQQSTEAVELEAFSYPLLNSRRNKKFLVNK